MHNVRANSFERLCEKKIPVWKKKFTTRVGILSRFLFSYTMLPLSCIRRWNLHSENNIHVLGIKYIRVYNSRIRNDEKRADFIRYCVLFFVSPPPSSHPSNDSNSFHSLKFLYGIVPDDDCLRWCRDSIKNFELIFISNIIGTVFINTRSRIIICCIFYGSIYFIFILRIERRKKTYKCSTFLLWAVILR